MPRKVRDVLRDLHNAGFYEVKKQGKGDHRKFRHPQINGSFIVDGKPSADAKPYQEKQLKQALSQLKNEP